MLGLNSSSANLSCIYCKKHKHDFCNFTPGQPRSLQNLGTKAGGAIEEPLVRFLDDILDCHPDALHLKLRVGDQYFKIAVTNVKLQDDIRDQQTRALRQKGRKRKSNAPVDEPETVSNMENFRLYLQSIGITWHYHEDEKTHQIKCGLNGKHHDKMIEKFNIYDACPNMDPERQRAFKSSYSLFTKIVKILKSLHISSNGISELQQTILDWHNDLRVIVGSENFTIYMHIIMEHLLPILKKHGSIAAVANEGVEKFNSEATIVYHTQSNHRNGSLKQCMQSSIREISTNQRPRKPLREQSCGKCRCNGHNILTGTSDQNETPVAIHTETDWRSVPTRLTYGYTDDTNC